MPPIPACPGFPWDEPSVLIFKVPAEGGVHLPSQQTLCLPWRGLVLRVSPRLLSPKFKFCTVTRSLGSILLDISHFAKMVSWSLLRIILHRFWLSNLKSQKILRFRSSQRFHKMRGGPTIQVAHKKEVFARGLPILSQKSTKERLCQTFFHQFTMLGPCQFPSSIA